MVFLFPAKQKSFFLIFISFLICAVSIFIIFFFIFDDLPQINKKIKKTVYKFIKPEIPSIMNTNILKNLQDGGHTVFIRHSARNKIKNLGIFDQLSLVEDIIIPSNFFHGGCLNPQGKTEAWLIGKVFRHLKIPVGTIYVSPTCRTRQTAQIAFKRIDFIEPYLHFESFYIGTGYGTKETRIKNKDKTLELINLKPVSGKNKIIVAHAGMLQQLGWPNSDLKESGMFIVKHTGSKNIEVITEISLGNFIGAMRLEGAFGTSDKEKS